ncbi:MAG TPA: hypothetical protein VFG24_06925 [Nitrosopumilaceae archaeon]|nr:hypothetical protein [Nitrosopumilaceae archaeon]
MQISNEEKNISEIGNNGFQDTSNSYHYQNEQIIAKKIPNISEDVLNKTIEVFYKIEQMNDEKIKQMIESRIGKVIAEEKYEKAEHEMQSSSNITPSIQTCVFKKKEV